MGSGKRGRVGEGEEVGGAVRCRSTDGPRPPKRFGPDGNQPEDPGLDRRRRAGRRRALSGASARGSLGIVVAGAVIEGFGGMCGDGPGALVTAPGIRFRGREVSAVMLQRGRMMWARLGRLVFAACVVGRVMEAGQAPGVRRERRHQRKQHQGACEPESRRMPARADHRQRLRIVSCALTSHKNSHRPLVPGDPGREVRGRHRRELLLDRLVGVLLGPLREVLPGPFLGDAP